MVWLVLSGRGMVNSVIINITTLINYRCNYSTVFSNINTIYNMYVHNECIVSND